jgi:hypothetical protein
MKSKTVTIILCFGGVLLISGMVAFLMTSSRLTEVNKELAEFTPKNSEEAHYQYNTLDALTMERDALAGRIPWVIGTICIGGICLASGAFLKIRDQRKDDNIPPK